MTKSGSLDVGRSDIYHFKPGNNPPALSATLSFLSMVLEVKNSEMTKLQFVRNLLLRGEGNAEQLPDLHWIVT